MVNGAQTKRSLDMRPDDTNETTAKRQNLGNTPLLKLLVPNYVAGALIGKGGEALNDLRNQYGGFVRLSAGKEHYPGTNERVVVVTGETSELTDINNHIMVKVEDPGRDSTMKDVQIVPGRCEKVVMVLTDAAAGLLIGRGGGSIKAIQDESQAKLSVAQQDKAPVQGERLLTISGTMTQRIAACNAVIDKVSGDISNMANTKTKYYETTTTSSSMISEAMAVHGHHGHHGYEGIGGGGRGDFYSGPPPAASNNNAAGLLLKARVTVEIDVADGLVGPIMGKQGVIIKDLVTRSGGARFKFADKSVDEAMAAGTRTLTITGDMKQAQSAYVLVNERIAQIEKESQQR